MKLCAKASGSTHSVEYKSSIHKPPEDETVKRLRVRVGNAVYDFGLTRDKEAGKEIAPFGVKQMDQNLYFGQRMTQDEVIDPGKLKTIQQNVLYENNAAFSNIGDEQNEMIGQTINDNITSQEYRYTRVTAKDDAYENKYEPGYKVTTYSTSHDRYTTKATTSWNTVYGDRYNTLDYMSNSLYHSTQGANRGFASGLRAYDWSNAQFPAGNINIFSNMASFYMRRALVSIKGYVDPYPSTNSMSLQDARYGMSNAVWYSSDGQELVTNVAYAKSTYHAASYVSVSDATEQVVVRDPNFSNEFIYTSRTTIVWNYKSKGATYTKAATTEAQTAFYTMYSRTWSYVATSRSRDVDSREWALNQYAVYNTFASPAKYTMPDTANQTEGQRQWNRVFAEKTVYTNNNSTSYVSMESTNIEYYTSSVTQEYLTNAYSTPNHYHTRSASADIMTKAMVTMKSTTTHNFAT